MQVNQLKIIYWPHSHFPQARQPTCEIYAKCRIWMKECAVLVETSLWCVRQMPVNFNINYHSWQMQMYQKLIWLSCFAKVVSGWKVEVLKSSSCQSRSDTIKYVRLKIRLYCKWLQSVAEYECHKISCACCTVMPTATERSLYVRWSGWIIICLNRLHGERAVCWVS